MIRKIGQKTFSWLDNRFNITPLIDFMSKKKVAFRLRFLTRMTKPCGRMPSKQSGDTIRSSGI